MQKNLSFVNGHVITMAIDNWQMIIDKFFLLGIMPCATIYGAVHSSAL
jgi:hypothetical protein